MVLPVAGYYRVSVARDDMKAPQLYEDEIRRYCHYRKLTLAEIFSDIDYSGYRGSEKRPALKQLVARRSDFSGVVIPKLSRFGRSLKHLTQLFDTFDSDGISLMFLDLGMDTSTSQGRLLRNIMGAFAEYESDVRSDYSKAAVRYRARQGLPSGGWVAYGYRRVGSGYELTHPESDIVAAMFQFYACGETMVGIARLLNAAGVPSAKGTRWTKPAVRKMLENHHYAALLKHDGKLARGVWPQIVSDELWHAVAARLAQIANRGVLASRGLYLLSGLISCGVCGCTLHHRTKQDRVPGQYVCRGTQVTGWCRGGGIAEHRAEVFIVGAYLERYGSSLVHDAASAPAPVPVSVYWQSANLEQRRAMLASALERVVLIPRPVGNVRGIGLPRGRRLEIMWAVQESGNDVPIVLPAMLESGDAKICSGCGRRRHISNFRLDASRPDGHSERCGKCRGGAPVVLRQAGDRTSYQEQWRRFQERHVTQEEDLIRGIAGGPSSKGKTWAQWQRELRAAR